MPTRKEQKIQEEEEEERLTSQELLQKEHQQAIDRSSHKNKKKNSGKTTDEARRGISHCSDIVKLLSNPVDLGGPVAGNIAVGQNPDGRLQIFARLPNGNIFTDWQDHGGNWSSTGGADLGGSIAGDISVGINTTADGGLGRLQIFARGLQNQIITTAQREPGSALFDPLVDLGFNIEGNIALWTPPWSPIPVPPPAAASSQIFVKENSRIVSYGLI